MPEPGASVTLIGANMAFGRHVLEKVPAYDEELGPGALGYGDETLFGRQLEAAGYRIEYVRDAEVKHHFDPARLRRESWLRASKSYGESNAYILHHWDHAKIRWPVLQLFKVRARRIADRLRTGHPPEEGIGEREFELRSYESFVRGYLEQKKKPRNYKQHGLRKIAVLEGSTL
jgi:hypothetical protein